MPTRQTLAEQRQRWIASDNNKLRSFGDQLYVIECLLDDDDLDPSPIRDAADLLAEDLQNACDEDQIGNGDYLQFMDSLQMLINPQFDDDIDASSEAGEGSETEITSDLDEGLNPLSSAASSAGERPESPDVDDGA